jgi:hypothetical protein
MTIHMLKHLLGQHDKALHLNLTVQDVDELIARFEKERSQNLGVNAREPRAVETIGGPSPRSPTRPLATKPIDPFQVMPSSA